MRCNLKLIRASVYTNGDVHACAACVKNPMDELESAAPCMMSRKLVTACCNNG